LQQLQLRQFSTHLPLFFFSDSASTQTSTFSLHDALPISALDVGFRARPVRGAPPATAGSTVTLSPSASAVVRPPVKRTSSSLRRSEEHTSELQSRGHLVCRLLLEKKNQD